MNRKKIDPVIRYYQPEEIRLFSLNQYQVKELYQGSSESYVLNFALFTLGIFFTAISSLLSAPPTNIRVFVIFVVLAVFTAIAGFGLLGFCLYRRTKTKSLYDQIL